MYGSAIYRAAPPRLQEVMLALRSSLRAVFKEGAAYRRSLRDCQGRELWSADRWQAWRRSQLAAMLAHARDQVPFYRGMLAGVDDEALAADPEAVLGRLPLMNKAVVRDAGVAMHAANVKGHVRAHTSGTSGSPLALIQSFEAVAREQAYVVRQMAMSGYRSGARRAWIRGDLVVPADASTGPFWRLDRAARMLMMSSYHLSTNNTPGYVAALEAYEPELIQAYPSSVAFLAQALLQQGKRYEGRGLRGVMTSSEMLSDEQRAAIEAAFSCPVFDWYGQTERVAAIGNCSHGSLHIVEDYSHVELVPDPASGLHEIVGTSLANKAMPLLRYRTGDLVEIVDPSQEPCACGSSFRRVKRVLGRQDDVVKLPDGRRVGRLDHVFKGLTGIAEAQIRQERLDEVQILVVALPDFGEAQRRLLLSQAHERLGASVRVEVRCVESLPRTANGKLRGVVCLV